MSADHSDGALVIPLRGEDGTSAYIAPEQTLNEQELTALVRRYERSVTDIDQRLKDIVLLLQQNREAQRDDRERIDALEHREAARPVGPPALGTVTKRRKAGKR